MKLEATGQGPQITPTNKGVNSSPVVSNINIENRNNTPKHSINLDTETKMALDQTTGLMQNITSDKLTSKVIRKMPSDEYLHLLKLLDTIIAGSVNKEI
jgi:uncharacterized FlaG/YvyC family protein